ncbi:MAG: bifunctional nuclease family protein [Acidimicrobiaceae bacterium]|nr:bifunctional nuclease family protein [Acidimicrobiaceae bacterium]MYA84198.1 bifunctional nuclease family protein [Acidimicrobiaceae bacterium]MYB85833.1 bifunctional nuclease family protein [Acidimicrobiaceae bacterium]MYH77049.1 bifunctional nuclease family protein [Acidimicrobiaceae bacterium]MYH93710.1 bifunctional nuclease family protein [Acidimicrobiaceae bacterium]
MQQMELVGVRVELPSNTPIVLLREMSDEARLLPIFIGAPEATAIAIALDGVTTPRPMTHDLLRNVLDELSADLERVVVTELRDKTFYAELHLLRDGGRFVLSSRPSDAIALAARTGTPIFAEEAVIQEAGYTTDGVAVAGQEQAEEVVEQFKEFIDSVSPEDFGSH